MKKRMLFLLFMLLSVFLISCSPMPNMHELLSYQNAESQMTLRITDAETVFQAKLTLTEEKLSLVFTDAEREGIAYCIDTEGKLTMAYGDFEIPLEDEGYLRCKEWLSLFRLSASETIWKIRKETLGGIGVFACHDGAVTVYVDQTTGLPLQLQKGACVIDVLGVE